MKHFALNNLIHLRHSEVNNILQELLNVPLETISLLSEVIPYAPNLIAIQQIDPQVVFTRVLSRAFDASKSSVELQRSLSQMVGKLLCVLTGNYQIIRYAFKI